MTISSEEELRGLQEAGRVAGRILATLVSRARSGVTTGELDANAGELLARAGARSAPQMVYGFPGSVCISVNDEVVHGVPGERRLRPGDVVTIDVTVEKDGYMADAARTVVVFPSSKLKRRLATCARQAFSEAMRVVRPGRCVRDIGAAIETTAHKHGFSVLVEHCGHGIGRTIHEEPTVPGYYVESLSQELVEGMVLAVEPLISAGSPWTRTAPDGWTEVTTDGSPAAHHENTVVVMPGGPLVLTGAP